MPVGHKRNPESPRLWLKCIILDKLIVMKKISNRITTDDRICNGKPIIRGKRITVQTILEYLSAGDKPEDILKQYYPCDG